LALLVLAGFRAYPHGALFSTISSSAGRRKPAAVWNWQLQFIAAGHQAELEVFLAGY
jgi:hypothetical protein